MSVSGVSNAPPPPPPDNQQVREQVQQTANQGQQSQQAQQSDQAQKDAAKQAAEAQKAQEAQAAEARRAAVDALKQQGSMSLPQEFMGILDGIVQEGYEVAKPPEGGKTGDQGMGSGTGSAGGQKNVAQEMQRDMQVIREFLREAKHMIQNQGMEVSQMLNSIKVAQGGAFWSKLQQVLQKGIPVEKQVLFQKLDKPVTELPQSTSAPQDTALKAAQGQGAQASADAALMNPGQAILELLKAEVNPASQMEHFLAGLYLLNKDGLQQSAGRLRSYLRRRGQLPEQDFQDFRYQDQRKEIFQGPMPKEAIQPVNFWYILLAIGTFAASIGLGLNVVEAAVVGVCSAIIMFVLSLLFR